VRELCGKGADPTAVNKEGTPTPEKKILLKLFNAKESLGKILLILVMTIPINVPSIPQYFHVHNLTRFANE
jgi:hypothetical protein